MTVDPFDAFYRGTSRRLLGFAYGLTGDLAEAQDLTSEAYVRAWSRWRKLSGYEHQEAWLRTVVARLATDRWRRLGIRRKVPLESTLPVVPPPDETLMVLFAALKKLPFDQRRALVLHYLLDMPVAEVADEIGANTNTVKSWLARGRASLAVTLGDRNHAN